MSKSAANPAAPPYLSLPAVSRATPRAKPGSGKGTPLQRRFVSYEPATASSLEPYEGEALLEMHWKTLVSMAPKGTCSCFRDPWLLAPS
jgi:hypothetical protein